METSGGQPTWDGFLLSLGADPESKADHIVRFKANLMGGMSSGREFSRVLVAVLLSECNPDVVLKQQLGKSSFLLQVLGASEHQHIPQTKTKGRKEHFHTLPRLMNLVVSDKLPARFLTALRATGAYAFAQNVLETHPHEVYMPPAVAGDSIANTTGLITNNNLSAATEQPSAEAPKHTHTYEGKVTRPTRRSTRRHHPFAPAQHKGAPDVAPHNKPVAQEHARKGVVVVNNYYNFGETQTFHQQQVL